VTPSGSESSSHRAPNLMLSGAKGIASSSCFVITTSPLCGLVERNRSVLDVMVAGSDQAHSVLKLILRLDAEGLSDGRGVGRLEGSNHGVWIGRDSNKGQLQNLPLCEAVASVLQLLDTEIGRASCRERGWG